MLFFLLVLLNCLPSPKQIELRFTHFRNDKGLVRVAVYNNAKNFCNEDIKPLKEISAKITQGESTVAISDLPNGDYAITVLHDENEDAVMNYLLGLPREGYAFSNNARPGFSKPSFSSCQIKVETGVEVNQTIRVRYLF